MAPSSGSSPSGPSWFTPVRLLAIFCVMNMMIYIDRGVIASNGVNGARSTVDKPGYGIQGDFGLTLFQDGLLPAAFMVGLLVSSPIFAEASKHFNAFRLIGTGLGVWTAAVLGCGLSVGFVTLLLCRMAVGVGEASFVALASPFIDDNAPVDKKTRWLATFYLCIPTGYALGYIYGGLIASAISWRAAFLIQGSAMLPFVAFCLRAPAIDIRGTHSKQHAHDDGGGAMAAAEDEDEAAAAGAVQSRGEQGLLAGHAERSSSAPHEGHSHSARWRQGAGARTVVAGLAAVWEDLLHLCSHRVYVLAVGGMTMYTAVLGTFAFYGPKAGRDVFDIAPERADLAFGAITAATGIFGTLAGGVLLDRIGSSLRNALLVCSLGTATGFLLVGIGFALAPGFNSFAVALAAGEFAMFMTQAPSNAICMWSVPAGLRPFAMSISVVAMHVLGDVPGPPLLGLLQGALQNWRLSMSICSSLLLVGAALYWLASRAAVTALDYRTLVPVGEDEGEGGGESADGGRGCAAGDGTNAGVQAGQGAHGGCGGKGPGSGGDADAAGGEEGDGGGGGCAQMGWDAGGRMSPERPLLRGAHPSTDSMEGSKLE